MSNPTGTAPRSASAVPDALRSATVSLMAAVSLLKDAERQSIKPSQATPSDKTFRWMLGDYERAIDKARAALSRLEAPAAPLPAASPDADAYLHIVDALKEATGQDWSLAMILDWVKRTASPDAGLVAALEEREASLKALGGCGDGGCIIHVRGGMHTNGGCRCGRDWPTMQRFAYINNRFAKAVAALARASSREESRNG